MALTSTVTKALPLGPYDPKWCKDGKRYWMAWGTFTEGVSGTSGDIETGLDGVEWLVAYPITTASGDQIAVNATLPLASGDVTIVYTAGTDGYWVALGWKSI